MTQQEKQELLVALCGYSPYGVQYKDAHGYKETLNIWSSDFHTALNTILYDGKPSLYLRSMSSMTEDERGDFRCLGGVMSYNTKNDVWALCSFTPEAYDWLNKKKFDYRGLITKELALKAPEGMYN